LGGRPLAGSVFPKHLQGPGAASCDRSSVSGGGSSSGSILVVLIASDMNVDDVGVVAE
jgi:hypothetical protein